MGKDAAMAHQNHGSQMLTANRLRDGDVLYRKGAAWVPLLPDADIYPDQAAADAALAAATAELPRNEIVAPYLFEVRILDGKAVPVKEREIIRAAGPTVHPHTGKQAGQYNG
jgi:hypothetical protein